MIALCALCCQRRPTVAAFSASQNGCVLLGCAATAAGSIAGGLGHPIFAKTFWRIFNPPKILFGGTAG